MAEADSFRETTPRGAAADSSGSASSEATSQALNLELVQLREQVKSMVRTEAKLHKVQNDLDHQLKIFGKLHELGVKIGTGFDLRDIVSQLATFSLYELGYERCLVLLDQPKSGTFSVFGFDGYYSDEWSKRLSRLRVPAAHPLLVLLRQHKKLLHNDESPIAALVQLSEEVGLGEFISYPLFRSDGDLVGLIMAGNSAEQKANYVGVSNQHSSTGMANLAAQASAAISSAINYGALQEEKNLLDQRVTERTRELAEALDKLKELDNAKSQFFSNVSHELRTPLTLSIAPLEEILHRERQLQPGDKERHLKVIYSNQLRLLKLINNLLDFAKIDAGKMTGRFQEMDLIEALRFYVGTIESAAEARKIALRFETDTEQVRLFLDRDKLEKIIMNLLSNAFKFTPDGGAIWVRVTSAGEGVELAVADTGIGIPKSAMSKLFQRFMQVDSSEKRQYEGTGIGLAMVKEYVILHGGEVRVDSELGVGTTFTIALRKGSAHLPPDSVITDTEAAIYDISRHQLSDFQTDAADEQEEAAAATAPAPAVNRASAELPAPEVPAIAEGAAATDPTDRMMVLVVDDVADMRKFVAHVLREKYHVKTARDGLEGLEAAQRLKPDLIVSDVMMPRMTGYELCAAIRKSPELARTPVILLTAKGDLAGKLAGLDSGADDYLTKPFNSDELLSRARNLLRLRLQEKQLTETRVRLVDAQRKALEAEIDVARRVQLSILPTDPDLTEPHRQLSGLLISCAACSGDVWMYRRLPDERLFISLGDVTGHGVGSAMVTELTHGALNAILRIGNIRKASQIMNELNAVMTLDESPVWMTMALGLIEPDGRHAQWCIAGHPPIFWSEAGKPAKLLRGVLPPLGNEKSQVYTDIETPISGASRFLLYSDGLAEAVNAENRPYGLKRLKSAFDTASGSPRQILDAIHQSVKSYAGETPFADDVTAVALSLTP